MKLIKWAVLLLILFMALSSVVLWSWGKFARRAMGEVSHALPVHDSQTQLDRWLAPLLAQRPDETGVSLISDNLKAFAVRAIAAQQAERSLDVQYYIWRDDLTGRLLKDELMKAAERGVRVRMLIDDMNGLALDEALLAMSAHPNVEVRLFNPARNRHTAWRRALEMGLRVFSFNRRMHNKVWVADGRLAIVGGRNIGDEYFDASEVNFHDADFLMTGAGVAQTSAIFDSFWNSNAVIPLTAMRDKLAPDALQLLNQQRDAWRLQASQTPYSLAMQSSLNAPRALMEQLTHHWVKDLHVLSDPPSKAAPIAKNRDPQDWLTFDVLQSMFRAQRSLHLISPYFVPGDMGVLLFTGLAARGVDVGIMTNSLAANDVPLVHGGYAPYRPPLLRGGVRLWELKPDAPGVKSGLFDSGLLGSSGASLHTKAFVVDGEVGFVGSFNFDPRSAALNTEMGVLFRHPALAQEVLQVFEQAKQPASSYALRLDGGALRWDDAATGQVLSREPSTTWPKRLFARVMGWLPIESQL